MTMRALGLAVLLLASSCPALAQTESPDASKNEPATKADVQKTPQEKAQKEDPDALGRERRQAVMIRPLPVAAPFPISISGAFRGGVQWIVNPERAKDDVFGFGAFDLIVTARPTPNITFLVDVEALAGQGPDRALGSLSRMNADADRTEGSDTKLTLREAWVRIQSSDAGVRFNVGKLDVTHYFDRNVFAEDETRQFVNGSLTGNPMLRQPPNSPGAAIRISQGDWRYAFGVHAPDDWDTPMRGLPYFIGELGRRNIFPLAGHYRWWARVGSVPDRRDDVTWGTGLSVDQLVTENTGLFFRAGLSRSDGEALTSDAWSGGVQHSPDWLGRPKDLVGVGYTFQRETAGRERAAEVYYNVSLAECCQVIANVEWIVSGPNQVTGRRNRDVVVPGLRALILF
jgi:hypothetical protein